MSDLRLARCVLALPGIVLVATLASCNGAIMDPRAGGTSEAERGSEIKATLCPSDVGRVAKSPLRRLSVLEYQNVLGALFPAEALSAAEVWVGTLPPDNNIESPAEFDAQLTAAQVESAFEAAERIAGYMADHPDALGALGAPCIVENAAPNDDCVNRFIETVGEKLLRRTLTDADRTPYLSLYREDDSDAPRSSTERLTDLLSAMLTDPEFLLFLVEANDDHRLTHNSVATRLALATTGSGPDAPLLAAARDGMLHDPDERRQHAERLLASPAGRSHVRQLFDRWLRLDGTYDPKAAADVFDVNATGLYEELRRETLDFVEHIVFDQRGSYRDLMTSGLEVPSTPRLAGIMGQDRSSEPVESQNGRAGLLSRPALLASPNEAAAPILRGNFIVTRFLCRHLGAPPPDADDVAIDNLSDVDVTTLTSRERAEVATAAPACSVCHQQINPPAFALSRFGPLGQAWDEEPLLDASGSIVGSAPVNPAVDGLILDDDYRSISGALELGDAIAASEDGIDCAARQLFRVTHLREPTEEDACHLGELASSVRNQESVFQLLVRNAAEESIDLAAGSGRTAR